MSADLDAAVAYVGHDQLVAMREARHYNTMIERRIRACLDGAQRVVDIGAGVGEFTRRLQDSTREVVAVEPDAAQRARIQAQGLTCLSRVQECPAYSMDGAYSLNVLEHIEDDVGALREWARVLRPGGCLFLYVPAFPVLYSAMDRAVGHYRRYTRTSLARVVHAAGLRVERSSYADSLGFAASLALRARGGDGTLSAGTVRFYDRWIFPASNALDTVLHPLVGKNVWLVARRA